jgi:hypothetical protein
MIELTAKEKAVVEKIVSHDRSGAYRVAGICFALASALVVGLLAIGVGRASDRLWDAVAVGGMILAFISVVWAMASQRMALEVLIRKIAREQSHQ